MKNGTSLNLGEGVSSKPLIEDLRGILSQAHKLSAQAPVQAHPATTVVKIAIAPIQYKYVRRHMQKWIIDNFGFMPPRYSETR